MFDLKNERNVYTITRSSRKKEKYRFYDKEKKIIQIVFCDMRETITNLKKKLYKKFQL